MSDTTGSASPAAGAIPPAALVLAPQDNVAVVVRNLAAGETITIGGEPLPLRGPVRLGHKVAIRPIPRGAKVLRYGVPIGSATADIAPGEHVHVHNLKSDYLDNYTGAFAHGGGG